MSSLYGRLHFRFSIMFEQNDEAAMLQGEHEAEKMIVEAYAALLLAFLSTERFVLCIMYFIFIILIQSIHALNDSLQTV